MGILWCLELLGDPCSPSQSYNSQSGFLFSGNSGNWSSVRGIELWVLNTGSNGKWCLPTSIGLTWWETAFSASMVPEYSKLVILVHTEFRGRKWASIFTQCDTSIASRSCNNLSVSAIWLKVSATYHGMHNSVLGQISCGVLLCKISRCAICFHFSTKSSEMCCKIIWWWYTVCNNPRSLFRFHFPLSFILPSFCVEMQTALQSFK